MITLEQIQQNEVRALTWRQPYGSLMLHGKQETRTWDTKYRGLVLICAGLNSYPAYELEQLAGLHQYNRILDLTYEFPKENFYITGQAIAIGELTDTLLMDNMIRVVAGRQWLEDLTFVEWKPTLFMHYYKHVTPIEPFPWKGSQGWRTLTEEQKILIKPL